MSNVVPRDRGEQDRAPGDQGDLHGAPEIVREVANYLIGYALAAVLTAVAFFMARTTLVWTPSIPIALTVLAIAQIGVHLVFFLHLTSGPDNLNNALALAFGLLIVLLLVFGSLWIMTSMGHTMPMGDAMPVHR